MRTGITLKQFAKAEFFAALDAYRIALKNKTGLVAASVRIHSAKGGVPKRYWPLVGKAFRAEQVHL